MANTSLFVFAVLGLVLAGSVRATPLDDYVNAPDPSYGYKLLKVYKEPGYTLYILNMTSQTWESAKVVSQSVWWHYLCITVPDVIKRPKSSFLLIDGGSNHDDIPQPKDIFIALTAGFAVETGSITADLKQNPNEPIRFYDDPSNRTRNENAILSWTWKRFIMDTPNDPNILIQLPQTKAAVRAMDTVQAFSKVMRPDSAVESFYVAGASKRGIATWLTAVVDKRVKAIAPVVFDILNTIANLHHHYRAYAGWSWAMDDFYNDGITSHLDDANAQKMADIIDPLAYRDRLIMPKMVISSTGDEFFLPDDNHYFSNYMEGETFYRIMPNAEHSCIGHELTLFLNLRAFYYYVFDNVPRPQFTWQMQSTSKGGRITVTTKTTPVSIVAFHARTSDAKRRDFRLLVNDPATQKPTPHPILWFGDKVQNFGNGTYVAEYEEPITGWLGFFIELTFQGPEATPLVLTTPVMIVPDTFPVPDCHGATCKGTLV